MVFLEDSKLLTTSEPFDILPTLCIYGVLLEILVGFLVGMLEGVFVGVAVGVLLGILDSFMVG